jgi:putative ABC transport system ATP-binding protein
MNAPLKADSLYRFFHAGETEALALRGVSLVLQAGEMVAVTGPSGSGKSTLLACLAGLDEPDGGTVWIDGEAMSRRPEPEKAALRARGIGLLLQSHNLIDHLTVSENIQLAQRIAGHRDERRAEMLCEVTGIAARASALPPELSRGEAARAGIAVALANDPALVLADEPTGELDGVNEQNVIALLRDFTRRGGAAVIVTHNPAVSSAADRILQLQDGAIIR